MKKRLLVSGLCCFGAVLGVIASRDDYVRDYSIRDGGSSSFAGWFFVILALIGYVAYNVFKKNEDDTSGRGCVASIIAVVIAFILFSMIVRALK